MGLGLERSAEVIPIRNVYYMLAYAFQALRERGYRSLGRRSSITLRSYVLRYLRADSLRRYAEDWCAATWNAGRN